MKRLRRWLLPLLLALACVAAHAIEPLPFKDDAERVRFQNLTRQLRCMVCQNEDLYDSNADLARDMRRQIFDMMREGRSDEEIRQYLVDRYSEFVLYKPRLQPGTWLLWFGPAVVLLLGAGGVAAFVRRRARADAVAEPANGDDW